MQKPISGGGAHGVSVRLGHLAPGGQKIIVINCTEEGKVSVTVHTPEGGEIVRAVEQIVHPFGLGQLLVGEYDQPAPAGGGGGPMRNISKA